MTEERLRILLEDMEDGLINGLPPEPSIPTLGEVICWAHTRQSALEEIRRNYPNSEAAKIAGRAMTMGPD